jgi:NAD(P)-dependent dehydrogenase (short-subunit alcohol dehydrogenase family)
VETVDFNIFASVRDLIDRLQSLPRLDVALLNAGVATPMFTVGPEGWETALQVNVLSTALLAILLLPKLHGTAKATQTAPHLCFVNSIGSNQVVSDWLDPNRSLIQRINDPSQFNGQKQYALIKLAAFFAMRGVAEYSGNQIITNAVCPGLCKTDLGRSFPWFARVMMTPFQAIFARTAEEGSRPLVSATALGEESKGKLWTNDQYTTWVALSPSPA